MTMWLITGQFMDSGHFWAAPTRPDRVLKESNVSMERGVAWLSTADDEARQKSTKNNDNSRPIGHDMTMHKLRLLSIPKCHLIIGLYTVFK